MTTHDAANRLTAVTDWNLASVSYAYDDAGRMTTKTLPAGTGVVSSYAYDNADRLTSIAHVKDGQTTIASVAYTLDDVGNRTGRVDEQGTHSYAYDDLYRLTSVTYPGPSTTSYAFDPFGNRTSMTNSGGTTTYAYDDADRLTAVTPPSPAPVVSYSWDDNGNLTARGSDTFTWDYEDRMVEATVNSVTTTFAYRGDGLRDSRTTGMTTTTFTWEIAAGLPVVLDDGNQYVYGAGLEAMLTGSGTHYYLADGLGSTMAMIDSTGAVQKSYTYDVYGKPTATGALPNEFDFAGQQTDASTGLQYLRARYMDPETGTFVSRDPLAVNPTAVDDAFAYGGGNPALASDPTGLDKCSWRDPWQCVKEVVEAVDDMPVPEGVACILTGPYCYGLNRIQQDASMVATRLYGPENTVEKDAFRHCYWLALMTINYGSPTAAWIAASHEVKFRNLSPEGLKSLAIDILNNAAGIAVGEYHRKGVTNPFNIVSPKLGHRGAISDCKSLCDSGTLVGP